ncbi:hypothetical protein FRC05_003779 [Tulasnella sp. 425]|nr:hypothetical protein FRC05_003779 [Tulasnella sp. 425]
MAPPPPPLDDASSHLNVPGQRPPPNRSFTLDDPSKLAPELDKQYLSIEPHPFASGAFSDVYPGRWASPNDSRYPDGVDVAIKVFRLGGVVADPNYAANNEKCGKHLGREVFVWQRVNHPRITPFVGYIRGFKDEIVPCIVSPKRQANLVAYITANPQADRLKLLIQSLEGLVYLHTFTPSPIVHLDIKPENILVTDKGEAELTDFGYAKVLDGVSTGFTTGPNPGGSYPYMAPETLMGAGYRDLTPGADIYAIGSTILYVLSGKRAWHLLKGKGLLTIAIIRGELPKRTDHPMEGTEEAVQKVWELLWRCWKMSPADRPSAQEVLDELLAIEKLGGVRPPDPNPPAPTPPVPAPQAPIAQAPIAQVPTAQEPIRQGVQFGINGAKWRHLPHCIGDKVKKEVRGYEFDKHVSEKNFRGFDKLPKADQGRVIKTFELDKPFDHVSFRKKPGIDYGRAGEEEDEESTASMSVSSRRRPGERSTAGLWPDEETAEVPEDFEFPKVASHCTRTISGHERSSLHLRESSLSSRGGKSDANLSSSNCSSDNTYTSTMPASSNAFKTRSGKGKKGKAIVKPTSNARLQWDVPKPPSPGDPIGSWGDVGPSWGDVAPSWGEADVPLDNQPSQPSSGSVWDNPALEPKEEPAPAAKTSEWGSGEWIYSAASANEERRGDGPGSQDNPVNEHQDDHNSENTGWGDGEWQSWGDTAADSTATAGWNDSNQYPDQQYHPHEYQAAGEYGSWGPSYGASTSWIGLPNDGDPTHANGSDVASPVKAPSDFRLNPTATAFIPKSIPPPMIIEVTSEAENSPYTVAATAELEPEPEPSTGTTPSTATDSFPHNSTPNPGTSSAPATCLADADSQAEATAELEPPELSAGTTPSTATDSIPQNSTPDPGTSSTPATCLADADSQTENVTEQLLRVNLEVAEYKFEVSKANLDVKMAALEAMQAKLEVMKQKRALLAASASLAAT